MKKIMFLVVFCAVILFILGGCSCKHTWVDADCVNAKTCSTCQETQGTALGHTPGQWNEISDVVACTISREQYCMNCNMLLDSEQAPITTMIHDGLFRFSPAEFLARLTDIAKEHGDTFTYECADTSVGLQVFVQNGEKESILQFFHRDTTTLDISEVDSPVVWCVSLTDINESDADFRHYFFMTCDPKLNKDAAFHVDIAQSTAFLNAALEGEPFGYHKENQLLYESNYIPEGALIEGYALHMVNIYASDFR